MTTQIRPFDYLMGLMVSTMLGTLHPEFVWVYNMIVGVMVLDILCAFCVAMIIRARRRIDQINKEIDKDEDKK